ncbi:MAG TPA: fibronectin type III domain-containing protein [Patescibacteria group bacterium]
MPDNPLKKSFFQRQIPTLAGLFILVVALVGGIIFVGSDTAQVFSPRATPQTTPKNIKVTNVTDDSFTISFETDEATAGFIKYGTEAGDLNSQISDDRDQLSGTIGDYKLHHITVRGLTANTPYFYVLGTGGRSTFDNEGTPFTITTARRAGVPSAAKTIYGNVVTAGGGPADGAIVYITSPGMGEMSALVKSSGSWAAPLSNARTPDGAEYATLNEDSQLALRVAGPDKSTSEVSITLKEAQPVATITLGQNTVAAASPSPSPETHTETASESGSTTLANQSLPPVGSGGLDSLLSSSPSATSTASSMTTLDLANVEADEKPVLTTTQPIITGKVAPNVVVNIEVNSETQITQQLTADANGEFTLDIEALKQELEPGEHTVTYSYTDPTTGQIVEKTVNFTVEAPARNTSTQIAQATTTQSGTTSTSSASPTPFGSSNPFPIGGATNSATATNSSKTATRSAMPSTSSAIPVSGSVGTTWALIIGGLFFLVAGGWSAWLAREVDRVIE